MRLTLKDDGFPYLKVMHGRKWIGRVYKCADNTWACDIFKVRRFSGGTSAEHAFREGAARYLGQPNAATLENHNSVIAQRNRVARAEARQTAQDMLSRDKTTREAAFEKLFAKLIGEQK